MAKAGIKVNLTETEAFRGLLGVIGELLADERIPQDIRGAYASKIKKLTDGSLRKGNENDT